MLIRFWCDSEITFSRGLHKNLVTVLYFSIINVLCGTDGEASFAPQANLVHPSPSAAQLPVDEPALSSIMTHNHEKDLCASELGPLRI